MSTDFVTSFQARDDGFGAVARKAAAQIRSLGSEAAVAANSQMAKLTQAMAGFASVGFLKGKIEEAMRFADEMKRASDMTGLSTDSLQELKFAADQTSVSFEGILASIKLLEKARVDAIKGNKEFVESFNRLGISGEQLKTLSADDLFRAVAKSINESEYSAQQLSDALRVLGRGAAQLFPLFNEGLDSLSQKARDAAVIISGSMLDSLDEAGDAMQEMEGRFRHGFAVIGAWAAEYLKFWAGIYDRIIGFIAAVAAGMKSLNPIAAIKDAIANDAAEMERQAEIAADRAARKKKSKGAGVDSDAESIDDVAKLRVENEKKLREIELKRLDTQERIVRLKEEESYWADKVLQATSNIEREKAISGLLGVRGELQSAEDSSKRESTKKASSGESSGFNRNLDELSRSGFFTGGAPMKLVEINEKQLDALKRQVDALNQLPSKLARAL